jgi:hypothetical protein
LKTNNLLREADELGEIPNYVGHQLLFLFSFHTILQDRCTHPKVNQSEREMVHTCNPQHLEG